MSETDSARRLCAGVLFVAAGGAGRAFALHFISVGGVGDFLWETEGIIVTCTLAI